ncbi:DMT family transporter [Jiangella alkaliphila]|uniref:Permease of the drug/metabolite transporter (DMT) superfamily n=1 Tax=Jiangella alkaliphila TaxID=419479 RepID=A0A1H2KAD9_9ACTN|nr:DMT family transporter [Jiangella alkaliphila]SDU65552.1 Permease of the drug/metabolite transporter (DMT) superfamily [Jiangella alkaliphila]
MSRRGWMLFIALGIIWGIPYMLIKVAVDELTPASIVLARTAIGAALLLPLAARRGYLRPLVPYWRPLLAFTLIEVCIPWYLLGYAEQELSSSLTGLLVAAVPLVGAVLVWGMGTERPGGRRLAGLLVGFAGVAALVGFDVEASSPAPVLAVAGTAVCYAVGPIILSRWLSHLPGLGVMAASLTASAVLYLPLGLAQWPGEPLSGEVWLSITGLGVVCTVAAFLVFFALVAEVGPSRATVITYVNPAVALLLGVLVLDERITVFTALGFGLILVGSVLATSKDKEPEPATVPVGSAGAGQHRDALDVTCDDIARPVAEP